MGDKPELRLALAMRGGVSLSVWIGGAVAEIDMARRADDPPDEGGPDNPDARRLQRQRNEARRWWRSLLETSGYGRVVVDVLAGASAGGLNGVLYAASQVYDFDYDAMRGIWLDVGGVEKLVRTEPPWPSLFMGDEYFLTEVEKHLRALIPVDRAGTRPRLNLELSATSLEPISRPVPSPSDEQLRDRRHGTGFRFRNPAESWLSTSFPPPDHAGFEAAIRRLALAARATSSFPVAFEAAEAASTRREAFGGPWIQPSEDGPVEMDGNMLDRAASGSFVIADGGILDNIPIGRALAAAVRAPAEGPTDRVLVYLQPGSTSSERPVGTAAGDAGRSTVGVIKGAIAARVASENINADIEAIELHNEAVQRAASMRLRGFLELRSRGELLDAARAGMPAYAASRAQEDAHRIFTLLCNPIGALGYDPFPRGVAGAPISDNLWRSPIATWNQVCREELGPRLEGELAGALHATDPLDAVVALPDPEPLRRVILLLLEWARWLESPGVDRDVGDAKRKLYRVHAFLDEAYVGSTLQSWVACAARLGETAAARFPEQVLRGLPRLFEAKPAVAKRLVKGLLADDREAVRPAIGEAYARIDQVVEHARGNTTAARGPVGGHTMLSVLAECVAALASELARTAPAPSDDDTTDAGELLNRVLAGPTVDVGALSALEIVCHAEFLSGVPGGRRLRFQRCSSENRTPLAPMFEGLSPEGDRIPVDRKLAGNELANFSAFLVKEWRENDWMWGRLDAVVTLVELLVRPKELHEHLGPQASPEERLDALKLLVLGPPAERDPDLVDEIWSDGAIAEDLRRMTKATDEERGSLPIRAIRDVCIARRQWEILCAEWESKPRDVDVREWIRSYAVGIENLQTPAYQEVIAPELASVATAASESLVWNLQQTNAPVALPPRVQALIQRGGPPAGRFAADRLLGRKGAKLTKPALRMAAFVLLWSMGVGFGLGRAGLRFGAGAVWGLLLLGLPLAWLARFVLRLTKPFD